MKKKIFALLCLCMSISVHCGNEIFEAIRDNKTDKLKQLIETDPSIVNKEIEFRSYPILEAASAGRIEMIKLLIEKGAKPNIKSEKEGDNVLHVICRGSKYLNLKGLDSISKIASLMKENGLNFNEKNKAGFTPIYIAANMDQKEDSFANAGEFIKVLIKNGAKLEKNDGILNEVLGKSVKPGGDKKKEEYGNLEFAKTLIELGADVNSSDKETKTTPLIALLANKSIPDDKKGEIAKLLLEKGANVNAKDKSGQKPLSMIDKKSPLSDILKKTKPNK